jgi:sulfatase modifying factor 1
MKSSLPVLAAIALAATACHSQKPSTSIQHSIAASNEDVDKDAGSPMNFDSVGTIHQSCPPDMVKIEGDYCPVQEHICLQWVDRHGVASKAAIPGPGQTGRCGTWKSPTRCLSTSTKKMAYCIDRFEYPNIIGKIPESWMSWNSSKVACEAIGKRLCTQSEWTYAAEGKDMHPYPYGDGFHRDITICNIDRDVLSFDRFKDTEKLRIYDQLLVPSDPNSKCMSDFGVYNMAGNIDEEVVNETGKPYKSTLMSGHVLGVRNNSFAATPGHNESFSWWETGTRCCEDIESSK